MPLEFTDKPANSPMSAMMVIVQEAIRLDASDIYVKAGSAPTFRVEGAILSDSQARLTAADTRALAASMMDHDQCEEFRKLSEINLALSVPGYARFRVNAYVQRNSVAMVMRRIKTEIPELDGLGLPSRLKDLSLLKNGLVLAVGMTGCGKSTTLAAMVGYRNRSETGHIVTIEDPIEFLHQDERSLISQREVGSDTDSFHNALRSALRQAPDVILVGEMRDTASVEAALSFAETGHLVLSTLHATNAGQTIERLLQFFPPEQHALIYPSLSNNLRAVIAQRLVPTVDGKRTAAVELLIVTPLVRDYLRRQDTSQFRKVMASGKLEGMQTFDQSLYDLQEKGVITPETALAYADSANDLRLRLRGLSG